MISCTLDHLHLRSPDPVASSRFYIDVLGAREVRQLHFNGNLRIVLELGGLTMFIEQVPETTPVPPAPPFLGLEHIGFTVKDLTAAIAEMRQRGITIVMDVKEISPELKIAFIEGPEKVRIELLQRG